jgi:DNA-binding NtrC family response regulator
VNGSPPLSELLVHSPSLEQQIRGAERAARTDVSMLVLGEPGTGRSALARAVHASSRRSGGPLVEVDISAIPASLFESELFGYRPGAFTGAETPLAGRVATAEGGTLLLDHVEDIPVGAQPKLLRLLAESTYSPLGGRERRANVRFLGIGSDDLPERVSSGAFRSDLFYRMEVVTLRLLPLRDRREDFPSLLQFFLRDLGERFGTDGLEVTAAARRWMEEYSWPGNLRELRNVLERALIVEGRGALDPPCPDRRAGPPESLETVEHRQILRALAYTRGHQGRAAELLGISRKTLWEKRRRFGIP